jgi:hypothetical protein
MRAEDLLGTWRLIGYHNRTAEGVELPPSFGPHVIGVMHFDANGRMIVSLADGRPEPPPAGARRQFSAYTGTWTIDGGNVNVDVDESAWAHFVGTVQVRGVCFKDGHLSLIPATVTVDGVVNHREVVWEKVDAR